MSVQFFPLVLELVVRWLTAIVSLLAHKRALTPLSRCGALHYKELPRGPNDTHPCCSTMTWVLSLCFGGSSSGDCILPISVEMDKINLPALDMLPDEVVRNTDVLRLAMLDRVVGD